MSAAEWTLMPEGYWDGDGAWGFRSDKDFPHVACVGGSWWIRTWGGTISGPFESLEAVQLAHLLLYGE